MRFIRGKALNFSSMGVDSYVEVVWLRNGQAAVRAAMGKVCTVLTGSGTKVLKYTDSEMPSCNLRHCFNKFCTLVFFANQPVLVAISRQPKLYHNSWTKVITQLLENKKIVLFCSASATSTRQCMMSWSSPSLMLCGAASRPWQDEPYYFAHFITDYDF